MTTENVRIAVRDAHDSETLTYMDNYAVGAIHFDKADLTRFFEGDTTALVMRINNKHPEASFVTVGNKLSFVYKNRDYWLNISQTGRDGYYKELVAFSLTWELYKEKMPAYTSPKAMTIAEIIKVIDSEGTLEIGINEMPDKKMVFSWDGIQNKKDRLYSAANQIGAELGLVTETNDDYSLKRHVINIYKEHTDTHQGLGQDKRDTTLRVGKELKVINQKDSADEFYTAIRATGKDGLSIVNLEFEERDDDGNILYFSKKGDNGIRALQARNKIPSNTNKKDDGYLFDDRGETEYTTVEALKGYMLSELKKISQIKVDYETQGYFDSDPGDTFSLEDSVYYNPPLYLEARVYEQTESLVLGVTSSDRTTFTNFVQKESEISNDLLARMRKLIEANKVFTYEIITSDGVTFKNGFGSTTLTARVRDGIKDITDTFSLKWYKDGTLFSNTKTVTINAADIEKNAVFRFEVADDSGNVRGGAEVTVTNIDDGKKGDPGKSPIITVNDDSSLTIEDDEGTKQTEPLKGESGKGVAAEEISYAISQDGVNPPTSGWSGARPTPKAGWYMWTRTRFKYTDNTYSAYFYLVAQQGKDAIIISATAPTNPAKEDLWQDPNDTTSTVYKWDGTKWIHWGISIDNLIVSNVQIENGVFKRVEGALIVGSEFRNPYTVTYNDGSVSTGTVVMEGSAITNSGVNKASNGIRRYAYEDAWRPGNLTMSRYNDDKIGDQNKLLAALGLTYDRLTLNDTQFAGSLSAEMLYDTGWLKVTRLKGTAGDIYLKRYMNRILIRFDGFVWDGSANGASTSNAVAILPDKVREGFPQMFTVPVWIEGNATEKFQVENGRLYKLSNNSGNSRITAVGEVYI